MIRDLGSNNKMTYMKGKVYIRFSKQVWMHETCVYWVCG